MRPRWKRRQKTPAPVRVALDDWPTSTITVAHHHTYAQRPRPVPPESFETWLEVNGAPVTGRLVFQMWSHSAGQISLGDVWRHLFIEYNGREELGSIVLKVQPRY